MYPHPPKPPLCRAGRRKTEDVDRYLLLSLGTPNRRVEARGDEDELGRELARHGHEDLEEGGQVVRVVVALRVERNVHVEAGPRAGAHVVEVRLPQLGPKRPELVPANEDNGSMALSLSRLSEPCIEPVDGEIKHSWIVIKRPLRALTVVDVPVHYQDLLYTSKIEECINNYVRVLTKEARNVRTFPFFPRFLYYMYFFQN